MSTNYVYIVIPIPNNGGSDVNWLNQCAVSETYSYSGACSERQYCFRYDSSAGGGGCKCAGAANEDIVASKCPSKYGKEVPKYSVYTYMGGDPSNPISPQPYNLIPGIGFNTALNRPYYPIDLTNPEETLMQSYAGVAYSSAIPFCPDGNLCSPPSNPYIVLAYDLSWFTTWKDLDIIAPPGAPFNGKNPYGVQNFTPLSSNSNLSTLNFQGADGIGPSIPTVTSSFLSILTTFCVSTSTTCPAGTNNGSGSCTNFLSVRTDGGINYCNAAMLADRVPTGGTTGPYGLDTVMASYCGGFAVGSVPPECYCVEPTAVPNNAFNEILGLFANPGAGNPVIPAGQGNLNCWWEPCIDTQNYLIPSSNLPPINPGSCPSICQQITQLVASGGGSIIVNNSTIQQNLNCCGGTTPASNCTSGPAPPPSGNCTEDPDTCPSGQQCINNNCVIPSNTPCSSTNPCPSGQSCVSGSCVTVPPSGSCKTNSDCPSGQSCDAGTCKEESFFERHRDAIIVAIFLFVFLVIFFIGLWIFG